MPHHKISHSNSQNNFKWMNVRFATEHNENCTENVYMEANIQTYIYNTTIHFIRNIYQKSNISSLLSRNAAVFFLNSGIQKASQTRNFFELRKAES